MASGFIQSLLKAELHLHLEGSVTPDALVDLRRRHGKESTLAEAQALYQYKDFLGFLMAFKTLTEDLQTPEDYELITYRLMQQLKAENVLNADAPAQGLRLAAHAVESAGPESIWGALNLGAERIGHGLTAAQDPKLIEELAQRQVPVEICLTSNLKTECCLQLHNHPVRKYFD